MCRTAPLPDVPPSPEHDVGCLCARLVSVLLYKRFHAVTKPRLSSLTQWPLVFGLWLFFGKGREIVAKCWTCYKRAPSCSDYVRLCNMEHSEIVGRVIFQLNREAARV